MKVFALNLLIALSWALVTGGVSVVSLTLGFVVGFGVLWLLEPVHGDRHYHRRLFRMAAFLLWYLVELLRSSLRVAQAVLGPAHRLRDGWLAVPLETQRDEVITLLANLISLTPGTLSVDVATDKRVLHVHALLRQDDDVTALEHELSTTLQRRLLHVLGLKEVSS